MSFPSRCMLFHCIVPSRNDEKKESETNFFLVKHLIWPTVGGHRTYGGSGCPHLPLFDCMAAHFSRFCTNFCRMVDHLSILS